jgi:hypothetical protein
MLVPVKFVMMKRYDIGLGVGHGGFAVDVRADGDWVLWADVQQLINENIVLRNEVNAARTLGDASPLALEFAKQQWLDARKYTEQFDKERS